MMIAGSKTDLVIPYGSAAPRASALISIQAGDIDDIDIPGAPVAVAKRTSGEPLRLWSLNHPFTRPPVAQDLAHGATQLRFLENHIAGLTEPWSKSQRTLVQKYFADVRAHVAEQAPALAARASDLTGLVEIEHWCFAALMPLPRAHIMLDRDDATDSSAGVTAMADIAFWTGVQLIACFVDTGNTAIGARKRAIERLAASEAKLIFVPAVNQSDPTWSLLSALGTDASNFLDGVTLPQSPFRGRGLEEPVRAMR